MFIPVPPKTSLPITTANIVAIATIHNGTSAGIQRGINIPETKNPSCTECPFLIAKINSTNSPDEYETITRGKTTHDPFMIISRKVASSPSTL